MELQAEELLEQMAKSVHTEFSMLIRMLPLDVRTCKPTIIELWSVAGYPGSESNPHPPTPSVEWALKQCTRDASKEDVVEKVQQHIRHFENIAESHEFLWEAVKEGRISNEGMVETAMTLNGYPIQYHPELHETILNDLQSMPTRYDTLTVEVLKDELKRRGLPLSGVKRELIGRLVETDHTGSSSTVCNEIMRLWETYHVSKEVTQKVQELINRVVLSQRDESFEAHQLGLFQT